MEQAAWMEHAWAEVGQREVVGGAANSRIVGYYRDAGHGKISSDEVPWCAAFVGACLRRAGIDPSGSLMARSYLGWGTKLAAPEIGAIAILSRGSNPAEGHVGFLVGWTTEEIFLLGGNQADAVNVSAYSRKRLLGLAWPQSIAVPVTPPTVETAPPSSDIPDTLIFETALAHVLTMEGGFTEDPYDPGGPTNRGVTLATWARFKNIAVTPDTTAGLKSSLRAISDGDVREIYWRDYWLPSRAGDLPLAVALMHFDAAVNHGVRGAARLLQEAAGADIDGEIGPLTLRAVLSANDDETIQAYAEARRRRYRALPHFWRFGRGWLARVDRTLERARDRLDDSPESPHPQQTKGPAMPDNRSPEDSTTRPDAKWWGHSMTIWGAIITTLSTVLPGLAPLVGLDLTAELVRQLGDHIVRVAEASIALVGVLLTIYGRTRATTRLERRPMRLVF